MPAESLKTVGKSHNKGYLSAIVWTGATTPGDSCMVKETGRANPIWEGRASGTDTYLGIAFPGKGLYVGNGVEVVSISSGRVYVYFMET